MTENYSLNWLCIDINEANKNYQHILKQLPNVVNNTNNFTDRDECVDFLTDCKDVKNILIVDDTIGQQITPLIHDIPQLDHIYVVSRSKSPDSEWFNEWPKVKEICTKIIHDSIAVSFIPINENNFSQTRHELDPSFMYTQILKDIILEMKYDKKSIENFVAFCRTPDYGLPVDIGQFEKIYHEQSPIWWYTTFPFIYSTLNRALRELKADIIIKMGFFIFDLHNQIKQLHSEQLNQDNAKPFTVYRGQALSKTDFEKLLKTKGGLISFNNFLSTSTDQAVSLTFAESVASRTDQIGILFKMTIDPLILSSPFADIRKNSQFAEEEEVLFSMHTVFRVGEIKPINNNSALYEVELELTDDDDEQLRLLTKHIENDNRSDAEWKRLGKLLFKIGQFDKLEELCNALLEQTPSDDDRMYYYNQLLNVKYNQGDSKASSEYALKMIEIHKKTHPANDIEFFSYDTGEYSRTLLFYKRSTSSDEESLPENSKTLFLGKAVESYQKVLYSNHTPSITSDNNNNNIAGIFENIDDNSKVLLFNEKIGEIRQKILPPDHRDLAISYYNIAAMCRNREEHSKALSFYEKSLKILTKTHPVNHPHSATVYDEMGLVYDDMEEYSKALLFCKKALQIRRRGLPENHPDLTTSYNNIASIYYKTAEYTKAVSFYKKVLPENHPLLTFCYQNAGLAYYNSEKYSKALSYHEKALEILEKTHTENRRELGTTYNMIGSVYFKMGEYTKALEFHEKAFEINQEISPPYYLGLMSSYHNIGSVYCSNEDYSKALFYLQLALNISIFLPSVDDSDMKTLQQGIAFVKEKLMIN